MSQRRVADLESDLEAAQAKRDEEKLPKHVLDKRNTQVVAIFGGAVIVLGAIGLWLVFSLENNSRARLGVKPVATTIPTPQKPTPRQAPALAARVASDTCRCVRANDEKVSLVYRAKGSMSLGWNSGYFLDAGLRMSGASGERETALITGLETVPPGKLEGGDVRFVLGCLDDRMVVALGHRVSAWALNDGRQLWSSTLPVPVGSVENGPLRVECDTAPVKEGIVTFTHAGGATRMDAKDGSQKAK